MAKVTDELVDLLVDDIRQRLDDVLRAKGNVPIAKALQAHDESLQTLESVARIACTDIGHVERNHFHLGLLAGMIIAGLGVYVLGVAL